MRREPWSKSDIDFLRENYSDLTHRELIEKLNRSHGAIRLKASKLGLKKFPDDITFFTNWSANSAYVIGLWAADGYVNVRKGKGIRFSISQTGELEILERVKELVGRGTLCEIWQTKSHRYEFSSKKLYLMMNKLFGHDVQAKSNILQWPAISDEYIRHFLRGYCDGDAHIGIDKRGTSQIRIASGSKDFINSILSEVERLTGIIGRIYTDPLETNVAIYIGSKAICLAKWMYSDCDLAIERKRKIAQELIQLKQKRVLKSSLTPKMMEMFPNVFTHFTRDTGYYLMAS